MLSLCIKCPCLVAPGHVKRYTELEAVRLIEYVVSSLVDKMSPDFTV